MQGEVEVSNDRTSPQFMVTINKRLTLRQGYRGEQKAAPQRYSSFLTILSKIIYGEFKREVKPSA